MLKKGIVALILVTAAVPFFASSIAQAYTSPGKPTGFVNDFAGILPADQKAVLESQLSAYSKTSGNEIAIVTVPSLGDETVETYATALFQEWGIGKKGKDNGVLLLVAPTEKQVRIEVGYGLEGDLTDAQSSSIVRNILTPAFKQGDYAGGISDAATAIIGTLNGNADAVPQDNLQSDVNVQSVLYYAFFIFIALISSLARTKSWWLGGVLGAVGGVIIGFVFGFLFYGIIAIPVLAVLGLVFDFLVSKSYASRISRGLPLPWWIGGGRGGGGFGGGFGGFGGGRSGGGGASGSW